MFCEKCGAENKLGDRYCVRCGSPLPQLKENASGGFDYAGPGPAPVNGKPEKEYKNLGKKAVIILLAIILAIIIAIIIIICAVNAKPRINVTDYISVEVTGADGYGTASIEGTDDWMNEAADIIYDKYSKKFEKYLEAVDSMYAINVTYDIYPSENLSNGDTVVVEVSIDTSEAGKLPFKLKASDVKIKVEGLSELSSIDLFEDLSVEYSGCAPYATAVINGSCEYADVDYSYDGSYLDNGDTFTVTAEYDEDELLAAGYVAESDTVEITVSGLESYASELSDISKDTLKEVQSQTESLFAGYVAEHWESFDEEDSLQGMEYLGSYFFTPEDYSTDAIESYYGNVLVLVYEINAWNDKDGYVTYYTTFAYKNITLDEEGNIISGLTSCERSSNFYNVSGSLFAGYYYYGYGTLEDLTEGIMDIYADYDYETTFEEE